MTRLSAILLSLILTTASVPASGADDASRVAATLRSCEGSSAQFVQRFLPKGYKTESRESGSVVFGKLPSMRWTYVKPESKEFVFDGTTSWLFVPSDRQVSVHELSGDERAGLPFFALSEPSRIASRFTIARNGRKTTLKARDRAAVLAEIVVEESTDGRLATLRYVDSQGNSTTFEFVGFVSANIGAGTFTFEPPAGTEVVRN